MTRGSIFFVDVGTKTVQTVDQNFFKRNATKTQKFAKLRFFENVRCQLTNDDPFGSGVFHLFDFRCFKSSYQNYMIWRLKTSNNEILMTLNVLTLY